MANTIRWVTARAAFPVIFFGALWITLWGMDAGYTAGTLAALVVALAIVTMALLERALPFDPAWNRPQKDVATDTLHMLFTQLGTGRFFDALMLGFIVEASIWLSAHSPVALWPTKWPLVLQFVLALFGTDFLRYWLHRASHEHPFLWRLHAIHHCPRRLYWLNAGRFHPLEELFHTTLVTAPLVLLGAPSELLVLHFVCAGIHGMFQHCNIDLKLGFLNYIFPMAELHRWHHALDVKLANQNYGNNVVLWDLVFGTYYNPKDKIAPAEIGVSHVAIPEGYAGQLAAPFIWRKLEHTAEMAPEKDPLDGTSLGRKNVYIA